MLLSTGLLHCDPHHGTPPMGPLHGTPPRAAPHGTPSGLLHCDPHPGNLLRTKDGKLCILDWGLVTTLDPDLQLTLIEHVAHLTAEDYARIPGDLVRLGFVPAGSEAAALEAGVVSLLTRAYRERAAGGGFARFDMPGLF